MMNFLISAAAGALTLLATAALAGDPTAVMEKSGSYDGPKQAAAMVARNEEEFARMAKVFGRKRLPPKPNFEKHLVAAVSMGQKPTGGYSVTILDTEDREGILYIRYRERTPKPGEHVTQALTSPYDVKLFPASKSETVLFVRVCEPEIRRPD
jgi:hypothetical protein